MREPTAVNVIATIVRNGFAGVIFRIAPRAIIGVTNTIPNIVEAKTSPTSTHLTVTGLDKSISRVLCRVSHGAIIGVTDEAVKSSVRVIKDAKPSFNSNPLPA
jgi:hypothetical protein